MYKNDRKGGKMNIKKMVIVAFMAMSAVSALALDYVEVIDVKARQRYPWNTV